MYVVLHPAPDLREMNEMSSQRVPPLVHGEEIMADDAKSGDNCPAETGESPAGKPDPRAPGWIKK